MERLMTSQRGVQDLEEFQFGPEGRIYPLFHTWKTKQFGEFTCSTHAVSCSTCGLDVTSESCFRVNVLFPVGHLQSGAKAKADHPPGTGPHCLL